jgi:hypothetical protein
MADRPSVVRWYQPRSYVMRRVTWKASLAGAALMLATVYAAAQMGSGQMPQGQMSPEQMTGMMRQMGQIMDHCSTMMRGGLNERSEAPTTPEKKD